MWMTLNDMILNYLSQYKDAEFFPGHRESNTVNFFLISCSFGDFGDRMGQKKIVALQLQNS